MKKHFIKIGNLTALLLLFLPIIIVANYESMRQLDFWIFLIFSISYDVYYYSKIMKFNDFMVSQKESFEKIVNNKDVGCQTIDDKIKLFAILGITTMSEYFNIPEEKSQKIINDILNNNKV